MKILNKRELPDHPYRILIIGSSGLVKNFKNEHIIKFNKQSARY